MMMSWLTTCIMSFAALLVLTNADDPCRYQTEKGIIDLTSLASSDGKAAYPDKKPPTAGNWSKLMLF